MGGCYKVCTHHGWGGGEFFFMTPRWAEIVLSDHASGVAEEVRRPPDQYFTEINILLVKKKLLLCRIVY